MKITVWDRIWSALSGVLIVLAGLWLLGLVFVVQPTWLEAVWMSAPLTWWQRAVMIVGALALIALGLHDVCSCSAARVKRDLSSSIRSMET